MKKYMVIEYFFPNCKEEIYARLQDSGRMLPQGLFYLDSWLEQGGNRCFQLMETEDPSLFDIWIKNWEDLGTFEVVPIGEKPSD